MSDRTHGRGHSGQLAKLALGVCVIATGLGCGGRQVQLLFPPQNDSGEYWKCAAADAGARPEHRQNRCERVLGGFDPAIGNSGSVAHVDMRNCEVGELRTITIVDADSDDPTVYITCGQPVGGNSPAGGLPLPDDPNGGLPPPDDLNGGLPPPDDLNGGSPPPDLNGGLPPPDLNGGLPPPTNDP